MLRNVNFWTKEEIENLDTQFEKSTALRFLTHVIGDVHQPLHSSGFKSNEFPKGDMGGNLFAIIYPPDKNINQIHKFFDSGAALLPEYSRVI